MTRMKSAKFLLLQCILLCITSCAPNSAVNSEIDFPQVALPEMLYVPAGTFIMGSLLI